VPPALLEVLKKATSWLGERGLESPRLDAEVLLAHGLGIRRLDLYLQHDRPLSPDELTKLRALVQERGKGIPVAYLTGVREFYALPFTVTRDVLVPRPETEGLVEVALAALRPLPAPRFADVGTGSGCVAVAVLHALPAAHGVATDLSAAALAVARGNAGRHGVAERFTAFEGSLLGPLRATDDFGRFDAVLSNPPYVVRGDPSVQPSVAAHEPALALYVPGADPLELAGALAREALEALAPGGLLAIEIGAGSGPAAGALLAGLGYLDVTVRPDGAGIPRIAVGRRPS